MMRSLLLFVCSVALYNIVESHDCSVTNSWNGGFQGKLVIHADAEVHGWQCTVKFGSAIDNLEIWKGTVNSHTGTDWTIVNMPWDADLTAGSDLDLDYVVRMSGDQPPSCQVCCGSAGLGDCSGGGPSPNTAAPSGNPVTAGPGPVTAAPGPAPTGNPSQTKYDYNSALGLSVLFFDAQRSGRLPPNNPVPWRGDSATNDNCDGHDMSGGWYDAGDHVKFGLPMAWSAWVLLYGMLEFKDGYAAAGQTQNACDMIRTPLEYFLKAWIPGQNTLYVQVGDGHIDHGYWGRPEEMHMQRPCWKVSPSCHGADVAGDTAAALAAGSIAFNDMCGDAGFAQKCLDAAKSLYSFAKSNRGKYTDCVTAAKDFYGSTGDADELAAAGAWLYKATNDAGYLNDAKSFYPAGTAWSFNWNDANVGAALLLYSITKDGAYKTDIDGLIRSFMPGGSVAQTPCGLAWRDQWGPNRHAGNVAFVATLAAKYGLSTDEYLKWAMSQINYLLGDNKLHISYEIGFGSNFPQHPHHRGSSCRPGNQCANGGEPNPNVLKGGLVGGPTQSDDYDDRRDDYVKNEVACDYNAGFESALAGLASFAANGNLPAPPAAKC